jgi:uncharacterized membrane protein
MAHRQPYNAVAVSCHSDIDERGDVVASRPVVSHSRPLHPLHAIFLAFPLPLFLGALLSDLAYAANFHVQWINFAQWLNAGGLLIGAFALLWALIGMLRSEPFAKQRHTAYFVTLLAMWVLGFINALVHGKDAAASLPAAIYLSVLATLLALVAAWIGYSGFHNTEAT